MAATYQGRGMMARRYLPKQFKKADIEMLAIIVRKTWVKYCEKTGDTKPSHLAPWSELSDWDKEADREIVKAIILALDENDLLRSNNEIIWQPRYDKDEYLDT